MAIKWKIIVGDILGNKLRGGGQFREKVGKKVGKKVGEKAGEKVGQSLREIDKLNHCQKVGFFLIN